MSSGRPTAGRRRAPLERAVIAVSALAAVALLLAGQPAFAALPIVITIASVEIRTALRAADSLPSSRSVRIVDRTTASCEDGPEARADKVLDPRRSVEPGRVQR
jgi:hypothetical protein